MKDNIFIHLASNNHSAKIRESYLNNFIKLVEKNIKVYIFYTWNKLEDEYLAILKNKQINFTHYLWEEEAIKKLLELNNSNNIVYINTFDENLIALTNILKKSINQNITKDFNVFTNKYLQRKLLLDYNPENTVKYIEKTIENLNFNEINNFLELPFILKPTSWIQSSWVEKINNEKEFENYKNNYSVLLKNLQNRWYDNKAILAEEYIDWTMYSIDYFVDEKWNIKKTLPVQIILWKNIWIDDFMNVSRNINKEVINIFNTIDLESFIKDTVEALNIKNTFIHHEFKITSKNKIKTIEVNGRIWGLRLEMIDLSYNWNLFELVLKDSNDINNIENNLSVIFVYPDKKWILKDFNRELIWHIKNLESFYKINIIENKIWKEIWLTKDWFWRVCEIILKNSDNNTFKEDYNFIIQNYKEVLILK